MNISSIPTAVIVRTPYIAPSKEEEQKDVEASTLSKPSNIYIEGDVYSAKKVSFERMNQSELMNEKISSSSSHTVTSTSDGKTSTTNTVAFRDPNDKDKIITLELSDEAVKKLKAKFGDKDFFERKDGILRLNGKAEEYVAGWVDDIKNKRNYAKADMDGDGLISEQERGLLKVGFERKTEYDFVKDKIVSVRLSTGDNYQSLGFTPTASGGFDLGLKTEGVENSVGAALESTIMMDTDFDGNVSMLEMGERYRGTNLASSILQSLQQFHEEQVLTQGNNATKNKISHYDIGKIEIYSDEEIEAFHKEQREAAKMISAYFAEHRIDVFS